MSRGSGRMIHGRESSEEIIFRRFRRQDASTVVQLGLNHAEFKCAHLMDAWSVDELEAWLDCENDVCVGAVDRNEHLIGYCLTHLHGRAKKEYVENIYVIPAFRRRHIGSRLIEYAMSEYSKMGVQAYPCRYTALVLHNNDGALEFFRKIGFHDLYSICAHIGERANNFNGICIRTDNYPTFNCMPANPSEKTTGGDKAR